MLSLGPLSFAAPWALAALAGLPLLWWWLRALPPAPREQSFPGTALLAGLGDRSARLRRTPWWVLLLRMAALACLIGAAAVPVWRAQAPAAAGGGPLLVIVDAGWGAAPGWPATVARLREVLRGAGARPVALLPADGRGAGEIAFADAGAAMRALSAAAPAPWETVYPQGANLDEALALAPGRGLETLWLSDGLDHPGRAALAAAALARGSLRVVPPEIQPASLMLREGAAFGGTRAGLVTESGDSAPRAVLAFGPDPAGAERVLARLVPGEAVASGAITRREVALDLPAEQRNRVTRFEIEGVPSAGAVWLADERTRRRKVALVTPGGEGERQTLLSPLHYLHQALVPFADPVDAGLADVMQGGSDVIILADDIIAPSDTALVDWVERGGTLIRFAGPRMAVSPALGADPLLPVPLRPGGRDSDGALSWGAPRALAPLPGDGPFAGLAVPGEVQVRAQLVAEPGPDLAARTLASLADGTPLVTRAARGRGQVVLFHVSADPGWSDLPLSGLFVDMLQRLVATARLSGGLVPVAGDAAGGDVGTWRAEQVLDGFGRLRPAATDLAPAAGAELAAGPAPGRPAGVWAAADRRRVLNAGRPLHAASWPAEAVVAVPQAPGLSLAGWVLAACGVLLGFDAVAGAMLTGRRGRAGSGGLGRIGRRAARRRAGTAGA